MESYNKLVRDKIPDHLDSKGISYEKRIANQEEYKEEFEEKEKSKLKSHSRATTVKKGLDFSVPKQVDNQPVQYTEPKQRRLGLQF